MAIGVQYLFLESRPRSNYRQLWVKGRHMRAEVLYRCTIGPEPSSPEEVAYEFDLPIGVVLEAIDYCIRNEKLLAEERAREEARMKELRLDQPPQVPFERHVRP